MTEYQAKLDKFYRAWDKRILSGKMSALTLSDRVILEIFASFLDNDCEDCEDYNE